MGYLNGKKVIGIVGSGRMNSNSKKLLKIALANLEKREIAISMIDVLDLNFSGCIECNKCKETGKCVLEDDLSELYDEFLSAPGIIISAPVYFYSLPGKIKSMIDRFQALWSRFNILDNRLPDTGFGGLISIAGSSGKRLFDGIILPVKYFYRVQGKKLFEPLLFRGYDGEPENIPE
ncbi:hypothetical protein DRQ33_06895, partial [bacterium]